MGRDYPLGRPASDAGPEPKPAPGLQNPNRMPRGMDLAEKARERSWYHVLDLGNGFETDGWFDLRPFVKHYGLPEDMNGMRTLEIGTWDGFWAFEMERRGAEVVALDLDHEWDLD